MALVDGNRLKARTLCDGLFDYDGSVIDEIDLGFVAVSDSNRLKLGALSGEALHFAGKVLDEIGLG